MKKQYFSIVLNLFLIVSGVFVLASCNSGNTEDTTAEQPDSEPTTEEPADINEEAQFQMDLIVANNLSEPAVFLSEVNSADQLDYHHEMTNSVENVSSYVTDVEKALGFGIYGADLSYESMFDKHQEMAAFLTTIQSLASQLGLDMLFQDDDIARLESFDNNPDSVRMFIMEKYDEADEYLRNNERLLTSALILTGGLIESMHLALIQMTGEEVNEDTYTMFLTQKNTLDNLIKLYNTLDSNSQTEQIANDLVALDKVVDSIGSFDNLTQEKLSELQVSVENIRKKIV